MKLSDIIVSEAIVPQLKAQTRDEAIGELLAALAEAGKVPKSKVDKIFSAILVREKKATTGLGKGVALPHPDRKGVPKDLLKEVKHPIAAIGCSEEGIDFSSLDSKPVYSVILLLSNPDDPDEHLGAIELIFKHLQRDIFRKFLRQAQTRQAVIDLIEEADEIG